MDKTNALLIIGAGQYGYVVKELAEDMGVFDKIDFLDDSNPLAIGRFDEVDKFKSKYRNAVVAIGNMDLREKLMEELELAGYEMPAIISPNAFVSKSAKIGYNTIIEPFAVINAEAEIGNGTFICAGAIVNHNSTVGKCCTFQCGSIVAANSSVSAKTKLDYNKVYVGRFSDMDSRTECNV